MSILKQIAIILLLIGVLGLTTWAFEKSNNKISGQPMTDFHTRPKLLTFGMYVTPNPDQNPIDPPERFSGYHTALDVEIFDEELEKPVEVFAICDGSIIRAATAEGYGGVFIQTCQINRQDVTVLYGHLDPDKFTKTLGQQISKGEKISELAEEKSPESGLTRKHLHLGIHKGLKPQLLGYVPNAQALNEYIDPLPLIE